MAEKKKLFPGVDIKDIENKEKQEKLAAAQKAITDAAQKEQAKKAGAYKKYTPKRKNFVARVAKDIPEWLRMNLIANAALFIFGSTMWGVFSHIREYDPEYDAPEGPYSGPYYEERTYAQAFKDAYWPVKNGKFSPEFDWYLTFSLLAIFALFTLGSSAMAGFYEDQKKAHDQIDVMLEVEKLANEHKLDDTVVKKMLTVAPNIVKHMSADSRVYFDMIMNGDVSIADKHFVDMATAVMVGHLKTHPQDFELIISTFDERSVPKEIMSEYKKNSKRSR